MALSGFQQHLSQGVIQQAQAGDILAFETIYLTYADASYNLAFRICNNQALAQDIVQEAFIKVMNKLNKFKHDGAFAGWVRRIVANETINRVKSESLLRLVSDDEILEQQETNLFGTEWLSACSDLEFLLKSLPIMSRAVIILHEIEGYKHKEIAGFFGKSESFSKTTLSRAYSSLMEMTLDRGQNHALK